MKEEMWRNYKGSPFFNDCTLYAQFGAWRGTVLSLYIRDLQWSRRQLRGKRRLKNDSYLN